MFCGVGVNANDCKMLTSSSFCSKSRSVSDIVDSVVDDTDSRFNLPRSLSACCDICDIHWARKFS